MGMVRNKSYMNTGDLLSYIKESETYEEAVSWHSGRKDPEFSDRLYELLQDHKQTPKSMIVSSGIDRSYFYHILSGIKVPGRNMVLRIGFCLKVSLNEMNHLLCLAGANSLYPKVRRDSIIIFAIQHKYTMNQANDLLREAGEEPLYLTLKK